MSNLALEMSDLALGESEERTNGYRTTVLEDTASIDEQAVKSSAFIEEKVKKELPRVITPLSQKQNLVEDVRQIFTGFVTNIGDYRITVRISDITDPSKPDEEIVFDINEIDERELCLVELGAQFYWHIGYKQGHKISRQRFSVIRFRRLPQWTRDELESAEQTAKEYAEFFKGD